MVTVFKLTPQPGLSPELAQAIPNWWSLETTGGADCQCGDLATQALAAQVQAGGGLRSRAPPAPGDAHGMPHN